MEGRSRRRTLRKVLGEERVVRWSSCGKILERFGGGGGVPNQGVRAVWVRTTNRGREFAFGGLKRRMEMMGREVAMKGCKEAERRRRHWTHHGMAEGMCDVVRSDLKAGDATTPPSLAFRKFSLPIYEL